MNEPVLRWRCWTRLSRSMRSTTPTPTIPPPTGTAGTVGTVGTDRAVGTDGTVGTDRAVGMAGSIGAPEPWPSGGPEPWMLMGSGTPSVSDGIQRTPVCDAGAPLTVSATLSLGRAEGLVIGLLSGFGGRSTPFGSPCTCPPGNLSCQPGLIQ